MDATLSHYYWQNSPTHILDAKLSPLQQHIARHHINSIHQLQPPPNPEHPNPLTPSVFTTPHSPHKQHKDIKRPPKRTLLPQPPPQSPPREEKKVILSPVSQIKKHLIREINLADIERALHRKKRLPNRFEEFCTTLTQRDVPKARFSTRQRSIRTSEDRNSHSRTLEHSFRLTHFTQKRRFWGRGQRHCTGESESLLSVQGVSRVPNPSQTIAVLD